LLNPAPDSPLDARTAVKWDRFGFGFGFGFGIGLEILPAVPLSAPPVFRNHKVRAAECSLGSNFQTYSKAWREETSPTEPALALGRFDSTVLTLTLLTALTLTRLTAHVLAKWERLDF